MAKSKGLVQRIQASLGTCCESSSSPSSSTTNENIDRVGEFIEGGLLRSAVVYCGLLDQARLQYRLKRRDCLIRDVLILHDNARFNATETGGNAQENT